MNNSLQAIQYKEALLKYAESFNLKKNKTKSEQQLSNRKDLYVIYARKSTEDDQRQVQSVEDQIDHCRKYAEQNGLEVVAVVREEKSAKIAGKRLKFQEMLDTITSGTFYNSILAWHPDRLSRNMKESGEILDMLDNDVISDLKFSSYTFNNDTAGKMTLSILFAMAK
jgi:site-specific DNA recombinase